MQKDPHRYDDMLRLPRHQSATRPHMPVSDRAAQFSPFAALTGYDETVRETARLTKDRIELDENAKALLDERLRLLLEHLPERPVVSLVYFVPDLLKQGGSYATASGSVKKLDFLNRQIVLYADNGISDGAKISINDVTAIEGALFRE